MPVYKGIIYLDLCYKSTGLTRSEDGARGGATTTSMGVVARCHRGLPSWVASHTATYSSTSPHSLPFRRMPLFRCLLLRLRLVLPLLLLPLRLRLLFGVPGPNFLHLQDDRYNTSTHSSIAFIEIISTTFPSTEALVFSMAALVEAVMFPAVSLADSTTLFPLCILLVFCVQCLCVQCLCASEGHSDTEKLYVGTIGRTQRDVISLPRPQRVEASVDAWTPMPVTRMSDLTYVSRDARRTQETLQTILVVRCLLAISH
ncbi:hypothetical protein BHM03_00044786 [Ensete ventricosum]|nr:hypothetical protein BHM03_00044786 [Ensete ventricosum]